MKQKDMVKLWGWIRPIGNECTDPEETVRRVHLAVLAIDLLGHFPEFTEESKLIELLKKRIKPGTPRGCITPNGRRDGHGVYAMFNDERVMVCAFCQEPM